MKKLLSLALSLVCLFSCISCFPVEEPEKEETYSLALDLISSFSAEHYIAPALSFPSPDGKVLYFFSLSPVTEDSSEDGIYVLREINLSTGEEREIFRPDAERFRVFHSPTGAYPDEVEWKGDVFSFVVCDASSKFSRFSIDCKTGEAVEEADVAAPDSDTKYMFLDASEREYADYEIPEGGRVHYAAIVNGKLYQEYALDGKQYYRELDLETKEVHQADITGNHSVFYGSFLLLTGKNAGKKDLYRFQNGELVCVAEDLPQSNPHILINQFKEFALVNSRFEKCFFAKDGSLHPLEVTVNAKEDGTSLSIPEDAVAIAAYGSTIYFYVYNESDTTYQIYKGTIAPLAELAEG